MANSSPMYSTRTALRDPKRPRPALQLTPADGFDGLNDPLAPLPTPRTGELGPAGVGHAQSGPRQPLSDVLDRAGAQLVILRRTLEEAAGIDRVVRTHATELAQRIEQGRRFNQEMDSRLESAGRAVSVLDAAGAALHALEAAVEQIRSAQNSVQQFCVERSERERADFETRLWAQREALEARLTERERQFDERLAALQRSFEERLAVAASTSHGAEERMRDEGRRITEEAEKTLRALERRIAADTDRTTAALDRQTAQAQARVSVLLDSTAERLASMEADAARLGGVAQERAEALCARAAALLGIDPRTGKADSTSAASIAAIADRAEEITERADEATVRLTVATGKAETLGDRLEEAVVRAEAYAAGATEHQASLRTALEHGTRAVHDLQATIGAAVAGTNATLAQSSAAEQTLVGLRDDLETLASSVRFNLSQAQQADAALTRTVDEARQRAQALDRAMDQVTDQAAGLVAVAKDVGALLSQAEAARRSLHVA